MKRQGSFSRFRRYLASAIAPELSVRRYEGASPRRFEPGARMGRIATETSVAAPALRSRARHLVANEPYAAAGVSGLVTYGVGAGPMPAHPNAELVDSFTNEWWNVCDADGRLDFGGLVALIFRAVVVDGECFVLLLNTPQGLRLRAIPAEQVDESKTADLGGGAFIASGIEFNAQGERAAYWVRPFMPTQQFETYAPPVRVDAADVLHIMRPDGVGQVRGVSWLAPIMLKLADLGLLSDALLKGFQVAAMHAGFMVDQNGIGGMPFDGEQSGDVLDSSLEPGVIRRLPSGYDVKFSNPQAAQNSVEFRTSIIEEISAGLGVPAFMVSGNVNRANYSSLRAALITFKASLEAIQYNLIVPQLLAPIWRRFALTEALRNGGEAEADCEWRFPKLPEANPIDAAKTDQLLLQMKLASRRELIAARGETIERVDADIAADPHAQAQTENQNEESETPDDDPEDSNHE